MIFSRKTPASVRPLAVDDPKAKWVRRSHVVSTTQGDSTILLDSRHGQYHTLNEVGGRVWALLADATTIDAMVRVIQAEYDAPSELIAADVRVMLGQLLSAGLLTNAH